MRPASLPRIVALAACLSLSIGLALQVALAAPTLLEQAKADAAMAAAFSQRARGDHETALQNFKGARALLGTPALGLEVAREQEALGLLSDSYDTALEVARSTATGVEDDEAKTAARELCVSLAERLASIPVRSSNGLGAIAGVIIDSVYRRPLSDGIVEVIGLPTDEVRVTDMSGRYFIRDVSPGTYAIQVRSEGYLPFATNVVVPANQTFRFDVVLTPEGMRAISCFTNDGGQVVPPGGGGCAGCAISESEGGVLGGILPAAAALLAWSRRRRSNVRHGGRPGADVE